MNALEILLCAKYNFENLEKMLPTVKDHTFYGIAKEQLDNGIKELEKEIEA